jgi:16S rRNA (guanine527-N7)-methyltransferase
VKHEGWPLEGFGLDLDPDQIALLEAFEVLLKERAVPQGMVAANDLPRLRSRHLLDCLRGAAVVLPQERSALDMGSGAGLPGIVMAIACPQLQVTSVEVRSRRAAFIDLVIDRLSLSNASVHQGRVEDLATTVDLCLARAFASASKSWKVAEPRLSPAGRLLYWAGESFVISDAPSGVRTVVSSEAALARSGPLVMMCRQ